MFFVGGGEKCEGLSLTSAGLRVRIHPYADVVELVDSLDLGAVTSGKVFREVS